MEDEPQNSPEQNVATVAATSGNVPLVVASGGHAPPVSTIENKSPRLTTKEVLGLFESSGVQRSLRSIERYCKEGRLVAFSDPDEGMYYIEQESAEQLISHLKEIQSRHAPVAAVASVAPPVGERAEAKEETAEPTHKQAQKEPDEHTAAKIQKLEEAVTSLEVDKRVRDSVISNLKEQLISSRRDFTAQLTSYAHQVGTLETRLLQLEGPKPAEPEESPREEQPVHHIDPSEVTSSQV